MANRSSLPRASFAETAGFLSSVVLPLLGKGVILRRPPVVAMAQRLELDRRAVETVQGLRERHGDGPLLLPVPGHPYALILSPSHVSRVLELSPQPYAAASDEKRASLSHFEPHGVLVSDDKARQARRPYNEAILDEPCPMHRLAERFLAVVEDEALELTDAADYFTELNWDRFAVGWWRMARRVVLGEGARDDHKVTDLLARLRADANWAFLFPRRRWLHARFLERLDEHLRRAEPGSLAAVIRETPAAKGTDPLGQVPQWLFALDGLARATFRTLALLGTHASIRARAEAEIQGSGPRELPFLRACVLDTLRLWPTTPVILRQAQRDVEWEAGTLRKGTGIIIFSPFFHRDETRLPQAHRFAPEEWLEGRPEDQGLVPFSDGAVRCPGRHISLMLSSMMLAALLRRRAFVPVGMEGIGPQDRMPGTFSPFALRMRPEAPPSLPRA
ncbi:cytochrome P450 [Roseomonas sp. SSH11]|uniref:Cytochrome P450 n=1 Tax=Pararoseomonas baculiformis TaxID=2820812 RepID=A0ABS4AE28_9PROT|nr:cytochrome P450 [Pararoseomonas baculiformis]MBP0445248.1 cytochrome P450 [Pararoseomonas baculiformis]